MRAAALIVLFAAVLSACAATGGESAYDGDMARLERTCAERGGILTPTGATTGRPQTEYACEIRGEPSGRLRN